MYGFQAGWLVQCLDHDSCNAAIEAARAERKAEADRRDALKAEAADLAQRVAIETGLVEQQDWSFDDYRYSRGRVLAESEHYVAREYLDCGKVVGFVIRKK